MHIEATYEHFRTSVSQLLSRNFCLSTIKCRLLLAAQEREHSSCSLLTTEHYCFINLYQFQSLKCCYCYCSLQLLNRCIPPFSVYFQTSITANLKHTEKQRAQYIEDPSTHQLNLTPVNSQPYLRHVLFVTNSHASRPTGASTCPHRVSRSPWPDRHQVECRHVRRQHGESRAHCSLIPGNVFFYLSSRSLSYRMVTLFPEATNSVWGLGPFNQNTEGS